MMQKSTSAQRQSGSIPVVEFMRRKYGRELLVDVAWISEMAGFDRSDSPYQISFYDVTLVTKGTGEYWIDTDRYELRENILLFTRPGQARRWVARDLEGICLFFPGEFLLEHFNDSLFLHRLQYFHSDLGPFKLAIDDENRRYLMARLDAMHREISRLQDDSPQLLRAIAYEILVSLNRWYAQDYGQKRAKSETNTVAKFRQLVEQSFTSCRSVRRYADMLDLTPGHLNYLCKKQTGRTAGDLIRGRVIYEAKRMLLYSEDSVTNIGICLGFDDASYFGRFFQREVGAPPLSYRNVAKGDHGT